MTSAQTFAVSASDTYPEDFRLLELTPELAAQLEALDTCTLRIAGRTTDTATLIDPQETTYSVHTAHTSNNLYLLTHAASSETNPLETLELRAKINQTLELQRVQPTVHARLREVLSWDTRGAYRGSEFDKADPGGRRVDDQALHAHVAVGPKALKKALEEVPAFRDTQGHWRTIDAGFCVELLRLLLATQVEHAWASCYDARLLHPALQADLGAPLPYEAVHAVLARFGRPIDGRPACYTIERRRVARFLAEHIFLAENMRAWPAADFAQALAATMPPQLASDGGSDDGLDAWGFAHIPRSP
ncbi:Ctf8p and Ctf18p associating protein, partial [Coemansia sp. RSA 2703]